ncbi:MAG: ribosomal protein S18-alanine N-acetyltransferase [Eubacteriales bacterium]|nr:ribosomal protein S18-alanine N-acetyltransferase [Eubacteriales bacterium]
MKGQSLTDNIIIRHVLPEEVIDAARIEKSSLSVPWSESELTLFLKNPAGIYLAAFSAGEMAGVCGCYAGAGECQITNIAVLAEYRRRGIAYALISRLLSEAKERGCVKAFLEVAENNIAAIRLYEKIGFKAIGRRPRYYKEADAINMTLEDICIF